MPAPPEVGDDVLEEGCYYLSLSGLGDEEIAGSFGITPARARRLVASYSSKLKSGRVSPNEFDRVFWEDVRKEAEGDEKVTFVSPKGFHHAWRSELAALDGPSLMAIFESSKDFLAADPNQRFLDFPVPKGYDPLALDREVRKAVSLVTELLEEKWKKPARRSRDENDAHA